MTDVQAWLGGRGFNGPVRPMLVRLARRWSWALTGALLGLGGVLVWAWDVHETHERWLGKVQALRQAVPITAPAPLTPSPSSTPDAGLWVDRLPAQRDAAQLWSALQQGLGQRGLQVQALRPQAVQQAVPLSSQAVALRLQGRFEDGVQAWASLVAAGPVWTLDRLTVTPTAQPGQLQWDGVWRVWLRPDAPSAQAWPALWASAPLPSVAGPDPFDTASTWARQSGLVELGPTELVADPRRWPLAQIRLLGVWQHGERLQAVLGAGAHWGALGPGAHLALEGYRVQSVQPDAVTLQARSGRGSVHVLRLEGDRR